MRVCFLIYTVLQYSEAALGVQNITLSVRCECFERPFSGPFTLSNDVTLRNVLKISHQSTVTSSSLRTA